MSHRFKQVLIATSIMLVVLNSLLWLGGQVIVNEAGDSLFFPVLDGDYNATELSGDLNSLNLDSNTFSSNFSSSSDVENTQANTSYAQTGYASMWGYLYSSVFAIQVLSYYIFNALGIGLLGAFISAIFSIT